MNEDMPDYGDLNHGADELRRFANDMATAITHNADEVGDNADSAYTVPSFVIATVDGKRVGVMAEDGEDWTFTADNADSVKLPRRCASEVHYGTLGPKYHHGPNTEQAWTGYCGRETTNRIGVCDECIADWNDNFPHQPIAADDEPTPDPAPTYTISDNYAGSRVAGLTEAQLRQRLHKMGFGFDESWEIEQIITRLADDDGALRIEADDEPTPDPAPVTDALGNLLAAVDRFDDMDLRDGDTVDGPILAVRDSIVESTKQFAEQAPASSLKLSAPSEDDDETLYTITAAGKPVLGLIVYGSTVRVISWPDGEHAQNMGLTEIPE